jgi:hypothetical protein
MRKIYVYILNNKKTVVGCFHCRIIEVASLLGYCAMWLGNFFPLVWMNELSSSSGLWVNSLTRDPEDEHCEEITQHHGTTAQKICLLNVKTALQLIKSVSVVPLLVGKQQPCCYTSHIFCCHILPVTFWASDKKVSCHCHFTYIQKDAAEFTAHCLCCISLSFFKWQVSTQYPAAIAFQHMSYTNCLLCKVIMFRITLKNFLYFFSR